MKMILGLGVAILSFVLVVALRPTASLHQAPEGNPAFAESRPTAQTGPAHRAESHVLPLTEQAQPSHAILLAAVEAETDSDLRSEVLERAVESVSDTELPALLDSLALDANPAASQLSLLLVRRWAENDPVTAAAWTSQIPEDTGRRAAFEQVALAWADTDLPAATGWVQALPENEGKHTAILALAYETARTEPVAALELTSPLPPTLERDDLLVHAVSQWAGTDSTTAAAWALGVADPTLRERLVAAVAIASAEQDGAAAATLAANALGAGDEQNRATVSIVQRWAQASPQAAASWVSQFPDIPSRAAAVENLMAIWTAQDADAAGHWLRQLPTGALRDFASAAHAQALADRDPPAAAGL
jgi:hypothetical protein